MSTDTYKPPRNPMQWTGKQPRNKKAVHTVRTKDGGYKTLSMGLSRAIKLFCTECTDWDDHPDICTSSMCPLFPFRGKANISYRGDDGTQGFETRPRWSRGPADIMAVLLARLKKVRKYPLCKQDKEAIEWANKGGE